VVVVIIVVIIIIIIIIIIMAPSIFTLQSRGSSVGIAIRQRAGRSGF
jgi:hypothetical protein